jgi:hypothetical protein
VLTCFQSSPFIERESSTIKTVWKFRRSSSADSEMRADREDFDPIQGEVGVHQWRTSTAVF